MPERDRYKSFSFGADPPPEDEEQRQERLERWRLLGKRLALGGVILVLLATAAMGIYVYRPEPVMRLLEDTPLALPATVTRAYKWKDSEGNWQISDQPPAEGTPYDVLDVRSDQNVMPLAPPAN